MLKNIHKSGNDRTTPSSHKHSFRYNKPFTETVKNQISFNTFDKRSLTNRKGSRSSVTIRDSGASAERQDERK